MTLRRLVDLMVDGTILVVCIVVLLVAAKVVEQVGDNEAAAYDPFTQANFPCAEDEALVYAPQFGPDRVGCLHVEGGRLAPEVWEQPMLAPIQP